jgi:predicted ATP-dependent Lon-type protease
MSEYVDFERVKADIRQKAQQLATLKDPRQVPPGSIHVDEEMAKAMNNLQVIDRIIMQAGLEVTKLEQEYNLSYVAKAKEYTDERLNEFAETRSGKHSLIKRELSDETRKVSEMQEIHRFFRNQRETMVEMLHFLKKIRRDDL